MDGGQPIHPSTAGSEFLGEDDTAGYLAGWHVDMRDEYRPVINGYHYRQLVRFTAETPTKKRTAHYSCSFGVHRP